MKHVLNARFLVTCAIISVLIFVADIAFHATFVPDLYVGYPQRAAGDMAPLMPFLFLTYLVQITMFLWLFVRLYPERGIGKAVWWGLWGGLFVVLPNMQFFVGVAGTTWTLLAVQVVEAIVLLIAAGIIFEFVYRPRAASAAEPARA
ncbi:MULTISPECIES: hypothetical protein [Sphingomonas]|uniref:Uncharacterized protein n=1 Tax=Edaphosphingomonas fennica TaxID=114404 RepID=A0A2T4HPB0_9SPHN|nr:MULTISPECIES: hypothetical protein [Sphingomonas]MDX3883631.1 hypothetical protein [Sphingomonas sp.]PTD17641.1 hypothetical protein CV103_16745 [Sphingomonas fennica]